MSPARLAPLSMALLLALAGCTGGLSLGSNPLPTASERPSASVAETAANTPANGTTSTSMPDSDDADPEPKPLPERPDDLTAEAAVDYAERYAEVVTYNRSLAENGDEFESASVDCNGTLVNETAEGFRVRVDCGTITHADGSGASKYTSVYLVADDETTELNVPPVFPGGTLEPRPLPKRPDELTAETAVDYAEYLEVVRYFNESLGDGDAWFEHWGYSCTGTLQNETADGYHVQLTCGGGATVYTRDDGTTSIGAHEATYFVNETTTTVVSRGPPNWTAGPPEFPSIGTNSSGLRS